MRLSSAWSRLRCGGREEPIGPGSYTVKVPRVCYALALWTALGCSSESPAVPVGPMAATLMAPSVGLPSAPPVTPGNIQGGIPCEIAAILSAHCALCHASPPRLGAPLSLMTIEDFAAATPFSQTITVAQSANARILLTDPSLTMPPPGSVAPLAPEDLNALAIWLEGGAQASASGCLVVAPAPPPPGGS